MLGHAAEFGRPDGTGRRGIVDEFEQASVAGEGESPLNLITQRTSKSSSLLVAAVL